MILDQIKNMETYSNLHKGITLALKAMADYTPENYETGRVDLDGDNVFMLRNAYETQEPTHAKLEAHRKYIDVMYMVEGEETIYVKNTDHLTNISKPYDAEGDYLLADFDHDTTPVRLKAGSFIVLYPQDAHAPGYMVDKRSDVKKIVGKVRVEE